MREDDLYTYYDIRSIEYDEIYLGKGPAIPNPDAYKNDVKRIIEIASQFGRGNLIDIGCGTCFWLPYYMSDSLSITLIDQSKMMLEECKKRLRSVKTRWYIINDNFFTTDLGRDTFDSAFVGFFISHLKIEQERGFFKKLKSILKVNGEILIVDSVWNKERSKYRDKKGLQERFSFGQKFRIYKRYFDINEISELTDNYNFTVDQAYFGKVFFALRGRKR